MKYEAFSDKFGLYVFVLYAPVQIRYTLSLFQNPGKIATEKWSRKTQKQKIVK